jgi:pimeloyl-ACP methyl ester carboxylesterase
MHEENWLEVNDEKLFYRKIGNGACVVLIHGFAEDGDVWNNQVDALKNNFQLIIPDLPGSGKSANCLRPSVTGPELTMDDYADFIKAILNKEGIKSCVMTGHSMGGYITLAFAEKHAELLKGLGLFHSTAYADSDEKKAARKKSIEFMRKHGAAEFIKQSTPNLFSDHTKENYPRMIEELIIKYDNFNLFALVCYYEAMMKRPDRTDILLNFSGPILFIIGEDDNVVPLEHSLQQSHIPGLSYIHILENAGHMGMWEATYYVNDFLTAFIKNAAV